MATLWLPGHPPQCTDELIWLAGQFAETIFELIATKDPDKLGVLECVSSDALYQITCESKECLGTDDVLNNLQEMFEKAFVGAVGFFRADAWDHLLSIATNMTTIRDQLIEEKGKLHHGTEITATG